MYNVNDAFFKKTPNAYGYRRVFQYELYYVATGTYKCILAINDRWTVKFPFAA